MTTDYHALDALLAAQLEEVADTVAALPRLRPALHTAAELVLDTLQRGGKVLTAGNGGSAAEAMHMAEELTGRYRTNRRALPGLALVADGTALTCIANDFGYAEVFARQIAGLGRAGDLLVLFSTSGSAPNLRRALEAARQGGLRTLALLGRDGGPLAGLADAEVIVPSWRTARVQELHQVIVHLLLEAVEAAFPMTAPQP